MIEIKVDKKLHGSDGDMDLNIDIKIKEYDFVALGGKSGSGKTTLLRILAGLEDANGNIKIGDDVWLNKDYKLPIQKREIGFVFQDYALFENMSIIGNLLYVKNDLILAHKLLEMTELISIKHLMPSTLSGGQKQRVAICRAMMNNPNLLLLDEPLSALDNTMRKKLQKELVSLHKQFNTTIIMVSHDSSEIYNLASRVITLDNGQIISDGSPKNILLNTKVSQKLTLQGEILDIKKVNITYIAIVYMGGQLVEVEIENPKLNNLSIGDNIIVTTKICNPNIKKLS